MEEIARIIEEHKSALNRVMKARLDQKNSTVFIGMESRLGKFLVIPLWILLGSLLLIFVFFLVGDDEGFSSTLLSVSAMLLVMVLACIMLIRKFSFIKSIDLANARFEFKGQLRKNRTYSLADYDGAETLRTIKGFPEEFVVKFKTDKGVKRYKLADLNMGRARNIEPNQQAVSALWDAIIQSLTQVERGDQVEIIH